MGGNVGRAGIFISLEAIDWAWVEDADLFVFSGIGSLGCLFGLDWERS